MWAPRFRSARLGVQRVSTAVVTYLSNEFTDFEPIGAQQPPGLSADRFANAGSPMKLDSVIGQ